MVVSCCVVDGTKPESLEEQLVLLTAEQSLLSCLSVVCWEDLSTDESELLTSPTFVVLTLVIVFVHEIESTCFGTYV